MKKSYVFIVILLLLITLGFAFSIIFFMPDTIVIENEKIVNVKSFRCCTIDGDNYYHSKNANCASINNWHMRGIKVHDTTVIEAENAGLLPCESCSGHFSDEKVEVSVPLTTKTITQINKFPYVTAIIVSGIIALGLCIFTQTSHEKKKHRVKQGEHDFL